MGQKEIRLLRANEIECRVGFISEKGLSLLLYKDARVDMKILDEVYGANNWQRSHEVIAGNLYCTVSIWDEEKRQWISKMDVGTKSNTEKEKGEASDSFKRACVSHGIGRELYTAPFIWVGASKIHIQKKDNKYVAADKFTVGSISYNKNREIAGLSIINQDGKVVYELAGQEADKKESGKPETSVQRVQETLESGTLGKDSQARSQAEAINKELARTGVALDTVLQRYGVASLEEMDDGTYRKAMNSLRRTKSKAA